MQVRFRRSVIEALPTPSSLIIRQYLLISFDTSSLYLLSLVLLVHVAAFSCTCLLLRACILHNAKAHVPERALIRSQTYAAH